MTAPIDSYCFRRTSLLLYTYRNTHKPTLLRTVITILFKLMIFPGAVRSGSLWQSSVQLFNASLFSGHPYLCLTGARIHFISTSWRILGKLIIRVWPTIFYREEMNTPDTRKSFRLGFSANWNFISIQNKLQKKIWFWE